MQFNRVPTPSLMFGEVLERIALSGGHIVNKSNGTRGTGTDRLCVAAAVIRLAGVAALGRGVPSEQPVVIRGMSVAHLGIIA